MPDTRFKMPSEPKNGLDLLRWVFFEPVLLQKFSGRLTKKESLLWFLKAYPWIVLFSCLIWMISILYIVGFDRPSRNPQVYGTNFIKQWQQDPDIIPRIYVMAKETIVGFFAGLFAGLFVGVSFMIGGRFFVGVGVGVGAGPFGGIISVLGTGLGVGVGIGFGFGIALGIALGIVVEVSGDLGGWLGFVHVFGIGYGIFIGLVIGLGDGFRGGVDGGLTFISVFYITYFRLIFYPVYILRNLFPVTFEQNPYRKDGLIWLPLWPVNRKLLLLAKQQPEIAFDFANFLLEYRPLQKKLAMRILQAVQKGESENMNSHRDSETQSF